MITPAVVLLLASYAAPTAAPDENLESTEPTQEETRTEPSREKYTTPETEIRNDNSAPEDTMTEPERAEEGRMVVPSEYR